MLRIAVAVDVVLCQIKALLALKSVFGHCLHLLPVIRYSLAQSGEIM